MMADGGSQYHDSHSASPLRSYLCSVSEVKISLCLEEDKDDCGNLAFALDKDHRKCIEQLMSEGFDVNCRFVLFQDRPLLLQAVMKNWSYLADLLLRQPHIDINICDNYGDNALKLAVQCNVCSKTLALNLIKKGIDVNAQNEYGNTALFDAMFYRQTELVHMLLYYGADVSIKYHGLTPFGTALMRPDSDMADILIDFYDFRYEDLKCFRENDSTFFYLLDRNHIEVFNIVWQRFIFRHGFTHNFYFFLLSYLVQRCSYSSSQWVRDFYIIFKPQRVRNLIPDTTQDLWMYPNPADIRDCLIPYCHFLQAFIGALSKRKIDHDDRISLIYVILSWGVDVCIHSFIKTLDLYGFGDELEALLYVGNYSGIRIDWNRSTVYIPKLPYCLELTPEEVLTTFFLPAFILGLETVPSLHNFVSLLRKEEKLDRYLRYRSNILNCLRFVTLPEDVTQKILHWYKSSMLRESEPTHHHINETLIRKLENAPGLPSLLELSRNAAHKYVKEKYKTLHAHQFHDVIKKLAVPKKIINMIRFKSPLY